MATWLEGKSKNLKLKETAVLKALRDETGRNNSSSKDLWGEKGQGEWEID